MSIGDFFWLMLWSYVAIAYLVILFRIVADLFGDRSLSGWGKALWVLALVLAPFLTALVYLIARGQAMSERSMAAARSARAEAEAYIRQTAGTVSPSAEIATAKELRDAGAISQEEFDSLKSRALASV